MTRASSGHPETVSIAAPPTLGQRPWPWASAATNTVFAGPWGISNAANLTPDVNTSLGIWTEDMFVQAIRTGRHTGASCPIAPSMSWTALRNYSNEELQAIWIYLRTLKPMTNHAPGYLSTRNASAEGADRRP